MGKLAHFVVVERQHGAVAERRAEAGAVVAGNSRGENEAIVRIAFEQVVFHVPQNGQAGFPFAHFVEAVEQNQGIIVFEGVVEQRRQIRQVVALAVMLRHEGLQGAAVFRQRLGISGNRKEDRQPLRLEAELRRGVVFRKHQRDKFQRRALTGAGIAENSKIGIFAHELLELHPALFLGLFAGKLFHS